MRASSSKCKSAWRGWYAIAAAVLCGQSLGGPVEVSIWHTQSMDKRAALEQIVDEFNRTRSDIVVRPVYIGAYSQLYHKLAPAIRAGRPPALAVAYESMVSSFATAEAVVPFDPYLEDAEVGLSKASRDDIFPVFLSTNRYPLFDNKMLSFPFTKSMLMLFYNAGMLREAGYERPPQTWAEFIEICRAVRKLGKQGYALSVDASTLDGMIFSFGGEVISHDLKRAQLDTPAGRAALRTIETLITQRLAYRIPHNTYDDREDVGSGRTAFMIRSSTTGPYLARIIEATGSRVEWDAAIIPHGSGCQPVTVLFGANICMFKTSPRVQRAAWQFVKYFVSTPVTAKWAMATGYLPVRKSATELPQMKAFYARARQNRRTLEALPYARREPNVSGWQDVRRALAAAEAAVCQGKMTADRAADRLQREAQAILDEIAGPPEREATDPAFLAGLGLIAAAFAAGGYLAARGRAEQP